jgi:hypothetical protein
MSLFESFCGIFKRKPREPIEEIPIAVVIPFGDFFINVRHKSRICRMCLAKDVRIENHAYYVKREDEIISGSHHSFSPCQKGEVFLSEYPADVDLTRYTNREINCPYLLELVMEDV